MQQHITFYKYQGTGNDFIIIDNRSQYFKYDTKLINRWCDRKFGIGADGLICLENADSKAINFKMVYFNADGNQSSMCGNGGRCIVAFAKFLNLITTTCVFEAIDGLHEAKINENMQVELKMKDVSVINTYSSAIVLDTGSPHYVKQVKNLQAIDVPKKGAEIRYSDKFRNDGINVNFVQFKDNIIHMRTYERGVEDETLSCGTGVTAAAIAAHHSNFVSDNHLYILAQGGQLEVKFNKTSEAYENIWLIGPTQRVFKGEIAC